MSDFSPAALTAAKDVAPTVLVLMGVSGSGKSTVAAQLQHLRGWPFQEGDDLHPPENVEKMRPAGRSTIGTVDRGCKPSLAGSMGNWRRTSPA